jgi:hypothetical protein
LLLKKSDVSLSLYTLSLKLCVRAIYEPWTVNYTHWLNHERTAQSASAWWGLTLSSRPEIRPLMAAISWR